MLNLTVRFAAVLFGSLLALGLDVHAQELPEAWKVDKTSGEVWVVTSGAQSVVLTNTASFNAGDSIRTGKNGRVMLRRGQETIMVSPNSVIGLPAETKPGATTIIQQAGAILLEVDKRDARTFQVETPYLVAAVKGTQFRVNVGAKGAGVDVQHGSVEVAEVKSGKFALVLPGQSANVSAIGAGGLSLRGIGTLNPIMNGAPLPATIGRIPVPRGGLAAPASIRASLRAPASATVIRGGGHGGLRIAAPIGQLRLDVNTATRGLAREAGTTVSARSQSTIWNPAPESNASTSTASATSSSAAPNTAAQNANGVGTSVSSSVASTVAGGKLGGLNANAEKGRDDKGTAKTSGKNAGPNSGNANSSGGSGGPDKGPGGAKGAAGSGKNSGPGPVANGPDGGPKAGGPGAGGPGAGPGPAGPGPAGPGSTGPANGPAARR